MPPKGQGKGKKRARKRKSSSAASLPTGQYKAPAAQMSVQPLSERIQFSRAAPHDEFPEGGLRLAGRFVNNGHANADQLTLSGGAGQYGLLVNAAGGTGWQAQAVALSCAASSATTFNATTPFGVATTSATCVTSIAQWFKFFRLRKLVAYYDAACAVTTPATVQIAYERDLNAAYDRVTSGSTQPNVATAVTVRTPVWQSARLICIDERKSSPSDQLFENIAATPSISSFSSSDWLRWAQGALIFTTDNPTALSTTAAFVVGRMSYEFVLDLYDFSNFAVDASPVLRQEAQVKDLISRLRREQAAPETKDEPQSEQARAGLDDEKEFVRLERPLLVRQQGFWAQEPGKPVLPLQAGSTKTPPTTPANPVGRVK